MTLIPSPNTLSDAIKVWKQYLADNSPEDVWFFVENSAAKDAVIRELKTPVLSDHITTLGSFAEKLVSEHCPEIQFLKLDEQLIIFDSIVKKSPLSSNGKKQIPISFINELIGRYNFFRQQDISLEAFKDKSEKHKILADIFSKYEELCGDTLLDRIDILEKAVEILQNKPVSHAIIYHINPANNLLQRLLNAVRGYTGKEKEHADSDTITEFESTEHKIVTLSENTSVSMERYPTSRDEAEAVLDKAASLIENGISPNDILILYPGSSDAGERIADTMSDIYCRYPDDFAPKAEGTSAAEVYPIRIAASGCGTPLSSAPVMQSIISVLSATENDFSLEDLQTIISSPYFTAKEHFACERENRYLKLTSGILAQVSVVAGVREKKNEWLGVEAKLTARNKDTGDKEIRAEFRDRFAAYFANIESLISWIESVRGDAKPAKRTFAEWSRLLKEWLFSSGWVERSYQDKAQNYLFEYLSQISRKPAGETKVLFSEFTRHIRHFAAKKRITAAPADKTTSIRAEKIRNAGNLSAKYVFMMGLSAEHLPNIMQTLSPFTAEETKELCPSLWETQEKLEFENFAAALETAEEALYLSCAETGTTKRLVPSPYLNRLEKGDVKLVDVPSPEITHSKWYDQITAGKRLTADAGADTDVLVGISDAESLCRRITCELTPELYNPSFSKPADNDDGDDVPSDAATSFREEDADALQPQFAAAYESASFSPTTLETYNTCPYKWFLKHHLKLYSAGEALAEYSLTGTVVHNALQEFIEKHHDLLTEEKKEEAYSTLKDIVARKFDEYPLKKPSWDAAKMKFLDERVPEINLLRKFIEDELARAGTWDTDEKYLEMKLETEISRGDKKLKIYGKADRVLRTGNDITIIDYKTGSSFADHMDTNLQIPLYLEACKTQLSNEEGCEITPADGFYLQMKPGKYEQVSIFKHGKNGDIAEEFKEAYEKVLIRAFEIADNMKRGICTPPPGVCKDSYCEYAAVCRKEVEKRWT